ncbi:hypothetical protein A2U01_0016504 [Trifolium medium]|uniref:Uncharacterized protein n=1 Tax=Trifolium medium TaxID=97028 RepID=A0A392N8R2_9FABA|nr:hypothetical protein [Trifolium medium]
MTESPNNNVVIGNFSPQPSKFHSAFAISNVKSIIPIRRLDKQRLQSKPMILTFGIA